MKKHLIFALVILLGSVAVATAGLGDFTRQIVEHSFGDTIKYSWDEMMAAMRAFPDSTNAFTFAIAAAILSALAPFVQLLRSGLKGLVPNLIGVVLSFAIVGIVGSVIALAVSKEKQHRVYWCHSAISKKLPDSVTNCDEAPF